MSQVFLTVLSFFILGALFMLILSSAFILIFASARNLRHRARLAVINHAAACVAALMFSKLAFGSAGFGMMCRITGSLTLMLLGVLLLAYWQSYRR